MRNSLDRVALGIRLQEARTRQGVGQQEIADHFGIAVPRVSNWERGATMPEVDKLVELSRLYGVSLHYLLTGEREPASSEADQLIKDIEEAVLSYRERNKKPKHYTKLTPEQVTDRTPKQSKKR